MKLPFENLDSDCEDAAEQKLSFVERSLMGIVINLAKVVLWKVGKAKTYGDLYKIVNFFETNAVDIEKEFEGVTEEKSAVNLLMSKIQTLHKGVKEL